jgi:hypothetical protein
MPLSPLEWFLLAIGALLAALLLSSATVRAVRVLYRRKLTETRCERQFLASAAFFLTFIAVRILAHAIRDGRGAFHDITFGGRHIHHLVWGILLLLLVGYGWLLRVGTGDKGACTWLGRTMAMLYGAGAALTLDEFALWLNLRDVYWQREGRESIDAVLLFGSLLSIGLWGGPFLRRLALLAARPRRALRAGARHSP